MWETLGSNKYRFFKTTLVLTLLWLWLSNRTLQLDNSVVQKDDCFCKTVKSCNTCFLKIQFFSTILLLVFKNYCVFYVTVIDMLILQNSHGTRCFLMCTNGWLWSQVAIAGYWLQSWSPRVSVVTSIHSLRGLHILTLWPDYYLFAFCCRFTIYYSLVPPVCWLYVMESDLMHSFVICLSQHYELKLVHLHFVKHSTV